MYRKTNMLTGNTKSIVFLALILGFKWSEEENWASFQIS